MTPESDPSNSSVSIDGTRGDQAIGGDVVGRDKISIGNITIEQFVAGGIPMRKLIEFFTNQIGLAIPEERYAASQYEAYCNVWRSLQALRLAGDDLWDKATTEAVAKFSAELRKTQQTVREGEIFFEEDDRSWLFLVLEILGMYRLGKLKLVEIHSKEELESFGGSSRWLLEEVREQILENGRFKEEYERRLEKIRLSFKRRLSPKSP